jgi:hypothetical protein
MKERKSMAHWPELDGNTGGREARADFAVTPHHKTLPVYFVNVNGGIGEDCQNFSTGQSRA